MPYIDLMSLRDQVTVWDVLTAIGWRPWTWTAEIRRGPCPLCGDCRPRSRILSAVRHHYYCHRCRQHGDALCLWMRYYHLPLVDAALQMVQRFNLDVRSVAQGSPRNRKRNGQSDTDV